MRAIKLIVYVFSSIVVAVFAVELLARMVFPQYAEDEAYLEMAFAKLSGSSVAVDPSSQNYSKKFGFRFSPNAEETIISEEFKYTAKTNSLGFRSKEIQRKGEGEYRVLLLGDSFFWGTGVDEKNTISSRLELFSTQMTAAHMALSVYNFAVSGYNTNQQLLVLRTFGKDVQPDHVVLGFFPGNDVIPNALTYINEEGHFASRNGMIRAVKEDLKERFSFLFESVIFRILALPVYVPRVRYQIAATQEIIDKSFALLEALKQESTSLDARFTVVIIHPRDSVRGGIVQAWSDSRKVAARIRDFCRKKGIEILDLLDVMNGPEDKRKYFFQKDGHFNAEGTLVVAQAIFDQVLMEPIKKERSAKVQ